MVLRLISAILLGIFIHGLHFQTGEELAECIRSCRDTSTDIPTVSPTLNPTILPPCICKCQLIKSYNGYTRCKDVNNCNKVE